MQLIKLKLSLLGLQCDEQWFFKIPINIIIKPNFVALKPDYMKLSLYNLSFRIPVYERSAPFSPLKHKSNHWSRKQSQILSERCTQFSRTRTSSNKSRTFKDLSPSHSFIPLKFTCVHGASEYMLMARVLKSLLFFSYENGKAWCLFGTVRFEDSLTEFR